MGQVCTVLSTPTKLFHDNMTLCFAERQSDSSLAHLDVGLFRPCWVRGGSGERMSIAGGWEEGDTGKRGTCVLTYAHADLPVLVANNAKEIGVKVAAATARGLALSVGRAWRHVLIVAVLAAALCPPSRHIETLPTIRESTGWASAWGD